MKKKFLVFGLAYAALLGAAFAIRKAYAYEHKFSTKKDG